MNSPLMLLLMGLVAGAPTISTEHQILVTQTDIFNINRVYLETADKNGPVGIPMTMGYFPVFAPDVEKDENGGQAFLSFDKASKRVPSIRAMARKLSDGTRYTFKVADLVQRLEDLTVDVGGLMHKEPVKEGTKPAPEPEVTFEIKELPAVAPSTKPSTAPTALFITKKTLPRKRGDKEGSAEAEIKVASPAISYRVDVGPESFIKSQIEKINLGLKGDAAAGKELFENHFAAVPLNFTIETASPHADDTATKNAVKNWSFVRHVSNGGLDGGGFLVVPAPSFDTLNAYKSYIEVDRLNVATDGAVHFEIDVQPLIKNIVLGANNPQGLELKCVVPTTDAGKALTACKRVKVGEDGKVTREIIVGDFKAPPLPTATNETAKPAADDAAKETPPTDVPQPPKEPEGQSVSFDLQDDRYPDLLYTVTIARKINSGVSVGNGKPTIQIRRKTSQSLAGSAEK